MVATYAILSAIGQLSAEHLGLKVAVHRPKEHYHAVRDKWFGLRPQTAAALPRQTRRHIRNLLKSRGRSTVRISDARCSNTLWPTRRRADARRSISVPHGFQLERDPLLVEDHEVEWHYEPGGQRDRRMDGRFRAKAKEFLSNAKKDRR